MIFGSDRKKRRNSAAGRKKVMSDYSTEISEEANQRHAVFGSSH